MIFSLPPPPPGRPVPHNVSSKILSLIDDATNATLDADLVSSWLNELDDTIQATKGRIQECVRADVAYFHRQLDASTSVQSRLQTLTNGVASLDFAVSNPQTGLVPTLVDNVAKHAALAQETLDALTKYEALSHLLNCRKAFMFLEALVHAGNLPEANQECVKIKALVDGAPEAFKMSSVSTDFSRKFRTIKALVEEQLSNAYSRSVVVSSNEICIFPSVQDTTINLASLFTSLSPESLSLHLATFRRALMSNFVDRVLTQPTSISVAESMLTVNQLKLIPAPPNTENLQSRIENISLILNFIFSHLIKFLPSSQAEEFSQFISRSVSKALLNDLLVPSLPSSFGILPAFMELLEHAVAFELTTLTGMLGQSEHDRSIHSWATGICGHYERQRRTKLLDSARSLISEDESPNDMFQADLDLEISADSVKSQPVSETLPEADDAWGLDESPSMTMDEIDDWGFNTNTQNHDNPALEPEQELPPNTELAHEGSKLESDSTALDVNDDAWGWNEDDGFSPQDNNTGELSWDDDPWSEQPPPQATVVPFINITSAKTATRLEKLASKNKQTTLNSPATSNKSRSKHLNTLSAIITSTPEKVDALDVENKHTSLLVPLAKETYRVSGRIKKILKMVGNVIEEGRQITACNLFHAPEHGSEPGSIILASATFPLDLFRALYPVINVQKLDGPEGAMQFSNDCLYLSRETERIENETTGARFALVRERLVECRHSLKVLGDSWLDNTVEKQCRLVNDILLEGCQGFLYMANQDRYDKSEGAISKSLHEIRMFAQKIKSILPKGKYYSTVGLVTDAALSRILEDVLALPDIPEVESHRISELCRILKALEGLFSEDPKEQSFVVAYVPSWLKYSYLSELLEASMADMTYLFEEGALVDFDIKELERLVCALFADSELRTNAINKFIGGHPVLGDSS